MVAEVNKINNLLPADVFLKSRCVKSLNLLFDNTVIYVFRRLGLYLFHL